MLCTVSSNVSGSFLVLLVRSEATTDDFDFGDLHEAKTMLNRLVARQCDALLALGDMDGRGFGRVY
jgi:hypothetical protein